MSGKTLVWLVSLVIVMPKIVNRVIIHQRDSKEVEKAIHKRIKAKKENWLHKRRPGQIWQKNQEKIIGGQNLPGRLIDFDFRS